MAGMTNLWSSAVKIIDVKFFLEGTGCDVTATDGKTKLNCLRLM